MHFICLFYNWEYADGACLPFLELKHLLNWCENAIIKEIKQFFSPVKAIIVEEEEVKDWTVNTGVECILAVGAI